MEGMNRRRWPLLCSVMLACSGPAVRAAPVPALPALKLQPVVSGLAAPLYLTAPAVDPRLFIVEQPGRIRIVRDNRLLSRPFLDLSALILSGGERGLLSVAFDPGYARNGFFYVYYTNRRGDIVISRYRVSANDPDLADPGSALPVLAIPRNPLYGNHNGGLLAFGPDGMLYAGTGDGGGGGDPERNSQNLGSLLGKLLRLDVRNAAPGKPYTIPADNPFRTRAGARPEIWAYGLRNPWRYAFDHTAGRVYIADVGQDQREEISIQPASAAGLNYGWNRMEGVSCYGGKTCNRTGLTLPAFDYDHDSGCSITGGYVYRGQSLPALQGYYFFSDYCGGWLKSITYRDGQAGAPRTWTVANIGPVLSFGEDSTGELYLLTSKGGQVYPLEAE